VAGILQRADVNFGILGERESCCGGPLAETGGAGEFVEAAKKNIEQFNSTGAGLVVTPCADCYGMIKVDYARIAHEHEQDLRFEVLHIAEYLKSLINDGKIKPGGSLDMKVTFHDPCHLGRLSDPFIPWQGERGPYGACTPKKELRRGTNGCYDPPRNIIRSIPGVELVEMERVRENSWCCGAGGGVKDFDPEFARWTAQERVEEALATGADALVTSCPWCEMNLADAAGERMAIHNVSELLHKSLEGSR
jgi:Fe-S oxidoreductase